MSEHTPGPWILDAGTFYAQCQLNEQGMTRESPIAEMLWGREGDWKANANLIAAAPDLLAALVEIKQLFSPDGDYAITRKDNMCMGTGEVFNIGLILMRASSAIAKATGD